MKKNISHKPIAQSDKPAGERMVLSINDIEYPFRWCPPGTFMMGSPPSEKKREDIETQHQVTLTQGFWMLETPVTQKMWKGIMGSNPSHFKRVKFPVENVTWDDCQEYAEKLNGLGVAPVGYRFSLPTEAQWEYACRAGTTTPFHFGRILNGNEANCDGGYPTLNNPALRRGESPEKTTEVGSFPANAWGLCDMHGNVYEWCWDAYADYPTGCVTDPKKSSGISRILRGGSWYSTATYCRSACRTTSSKGGSSRFDIGVRISLVRK